MRKTIFLIAILSLLIVTLVKGQSCSPQGNETSYGNNNVWRAYVYDNINFTNYKGFINEGTASSPNFDENFGGSNTTYSTNGCSIQTETFSVRYKLSRTFTNGTYNITVGGDDGYRLSLDGGASWVINKWNDQSYTTTDYSVVLNGSYNLVLEYYENSGDNRISFTISAPCGTENTATYGTNNSWNGYLYDGMNFNTYIGMIHEGTSGSPFFTEGFGGSNVSYATSGCSVQTETFSARFRLTKTFTSGSYTFFVGGDDGYRLSIDGGNTWVINKWVDQSYNVTNVTLNLNGTYNMVLEFYENGGENTLSFSYLFGSALAVKLISFNGAEKNGMTALNWDVTTTSDPDYFNVERSTDGINFTTAGTMKGTAGQNNGTSISYAFTDISSPAGKSYYRLKMVDLHGAITYSNTVFVNIASTGNEMTKIFPTVVTTGKTVNMRPGQTLNNAIISVIDLSGRLVSTHIAGKLAAGQSISFDPGIKQGTKGIYLVRVTDDYKEVTTQKIMVQ